MRPTRYIYHYNVKLLKCYLFKSFLIGTSVRLNNMFFDVLIKVGCLVSWAKHQVLKTTSLVRREELILLLHDVDKCNVAIKASNVYPVTFSVLAQVATNN